MRRPDPAALCTCSAARARVAGDVDAVISGDKGDVLSLGEVDGIPIITAREAVLRLGLEEHEGHR